MGPLAVENSFGMPMKMPVHSLARTRHKRIGGSYDPVLPIRSLFYAGAPSCLGHHLIVEMQNAKELANPSLIEAAMRAGALCAGATLLNLHIHEFATHGGVTCTASLAESHISIHTWPEHGYAALDVFMCGECNPYACLPDIVTAFGPEHIEIQEIIRGSNSRASAAI